MDTLRIVRHESYEAAGSYHAAHSEFFTDLANGDKIHIAKAATRARTAAKLYRLSLEKLISYLTDLGLATSHGEELLRAMQTLETLDREIKTLKTYQQDEAGE